jgi:MFS family permease
MSATAARYRVTAFALGLAALAYVQRVAISQAAEAIQVDLGLGKAEMGMVFGAFGLSYALFEIPNGLLGDRLGVRVTLTRIVIAWSVFTALTGAAWNFTSLWIARFLFGAGEAGCFPNLTRMLSTWLPLRSRLRAQALSGAMNMFGNFAGFVAPVVSGTILARSTGDWNLLIYLMVAASFIAATCWIFLDPGSPAAQARTLTTIEEST